VRTFCCKEHTCAWPPGVSALQRLCDLRQVSTLSGLHMPSCTLKGLQCVCVYARVHMHMIRSSAHGMNFSQRMKGRWFHGLQLVVPVLHNHTLTSLWEVWSNSKAHNSGIVWV
jgi:hypothetical protein